MSTKTTNTESLNEKFMTEQYAYENVIEEQSILLTDHELSYEKFAEEQQVLGGIKTHDKSTYMPEEPIYLLLNQLLQGQHLIFKPTFREHHVLKPIPKKK